MTPNRKISKQTHDLLNNFKSELTNALQRDGISIDDINSYNSRDQLKIPGKPKPKPFNPPTCDCSYIPYDNVGQEDMWTPDGSCNVSRDCVIGEGIAIPLYTDHWNAYCNRLPNGSCGCECRYEPPKPPPPTCCDIRLQDECIACPDCWWDEQGTGCQSNGGMGICNPTQCISILDPDDDGDTGEDDNDVITTCDPNDTNPTGQSQECIDLNQGTPYCDNGTCVECLDTTDCPLGSNTTCFNGQCLTEDELEPNTQCLNPGAVNYELSPDSYLGECIQTEEECLNYLSEAYATSTPYTGALLIDNCCCFTLEGWSYENLDGDINGDGYYNILDVVQLVQFILNDEEQISQNYLPPYMGGDVDFECPDCPDCDSCCEECPDCDSCCEECPDCPDCDELGCCDGLIPGDSCDDLYDECNSCCPVYGCTDVSACNHDELATDDDDSCEYTEDGPGGMFDPPGLGPFSCNFNDCMGYLDPDVYVYPEGHQNAGYDCISINPNCGKANSGIVYILDCDDSCISLAIWETYLESHNGVCFDGSGINANFACDSKEQLNGEVFYFNCSLGNCNDVCGVCNGDGTSCTDCNGNVEGNNLTDQYPLSDTNTLTLDFTSQMPAGCCFAENKIMYYIDVDLDGLGEDTPTNEPPDYNGYPLCPNNPNLVDHCYSTSAESIGCGEIINSNSCNSTDGCIWGTPFVSNYLDNCVGGIIDICGNCTGDSDYPGTSVCGGCLNAEACNYDNTKTWDDGSCCFEGPGDGTCDSQYCDCNGNLPAENYNCDGACIVETDCAGICGGDSTLDVCGVCGGSGIPDGFCDCNGNVCDCSDFSCTADSNACGGDTLIDCHGDCDGSALIDDCGTCTGGNTGLDTNYLQDCNGDCLGGAFIDDCGECVGGLTGLTENYLQDECGVCNGSGELDDCGVCDGDNCSCVSCPCPDYCSGDTEYSEGSSTCIDGECSDCTYTSTSCAGDGCNGDYCLINPCAGDDYDGCPENETCLNNNGEALCVCVSGNYDCNGLCDGTAEDLGCGCGLDGPSGCDNTCGSTLVDDGCGICGGDNTTCDTCDDGGFNCGTMISYGNYSGCFTGTGCTGNGVTDICLNLVNDDCGICNGDNSDKDCNGDCNGSAVIDDCGICSGGNTGHVANSDDLGCGCFNPAAIDCTLDSSYGCGPNSACIPEDVCFTPDVCNTCDGSIIDLGCGCGEDAAENGFDCDGNCLTPEDCNGDCGGSAVIDECGVCGGDNSSCTGCMYPEADNFDPSATIESGDCVFGLRAESDNIQILGSLQVPQESGQKETYWHPFYYPYSNKISVLNIYEHIWLENPADVCGDDLWRDCDMSEVLTLEETISDFIESYSRNGMNKQANNTALGWSISSQDPDELDLGNTDDNECDFTESGTCITKGFVGRIGLNIDYGDIPCTGECPSQALGGSRVCGGGVREEMLDCEGVIGWLKIKGESQAGGPVE